MSTNPTPRHLPHDMRFPLRYQLMLPFLAVAIGSLLAVAVIASWLATRDTRQRIEGHLQGVVAVLTTSTFPLTEPVLNKMRNLSRAEFVLADGAGNAMISTLAESAAEVPADRVGSSTESIDWGRPTTILGRRYFHSALAHRDQRGGKDVVLHILFPDEEYRAAWRSAFLPPLVVGVVTVVAIALATQLVAARISRVARRLGDDVQRLADGDFTPLGLPSRDDELRDLALAVNQTASRLARYEQHVRRTEQLRTVALLGAGLAHEIRNAATGCRIAVDLHAEGCVHADADQTLAVARQQLDLMESRLRRFLELGKKPTKLETQTTDLAQIVDDILAIVRPAARHAGVALDWRFPDRPITAPVDVEMFGQAVVNLVLNAIEAVHKHDAGAHSSGQVTVQLTELATGGAQLEICDSGPGPQEEVAERLFEPFVTSKREGVGLGLVVVKQVVDAHGGRIDWFREAGLTRFRVRLPQAAGELSHV